MIPKNSEIRVETSTLCNYNCTICARDNFCRKKEIMPTEKFKFYIDKIISETTQYDTVTFSGFGEPLLDEAFMEKVRFAKECGLKILLLTNASLLSLALFKELDSIGVKSIRVSFYGMTPKSYNKAHGVNGDYFERIFKNLQEICRMKRKTKILMTYNSIDGVNKKEMEDWINIWKPITDLIEIWHPHNWVYGKNYRKIQLGQTKTCGRPWNTPLQLQVDGTVNMCCFDFNGDLLLGDLNTHNLKDIFKSKMFNEILCCHERGQFKDSGLICEKCDQRNSNKSDVLIYSSKFNAKDRVGRVSTTYSKLV